MGASRPKAPLGPIWPFDGQSEGHDRGCWACSEWDPASGRSGRLCNAAPGAVWPMRPPRSGDPPRHRANPPRSGDPRVGDTWTRMSRSRWTLQRCQAAPSRVAAMAAWIPRWASEVARRTPSRPRATSERRNAVQDAADSAAADRAAHDLALTALVDRDGDEEGGVHDTTAVPDLLVLGVEPQIRIGRPLEPPLPEGGQVRVELGHEAAHLALADARAAHGAHEVIDLARRDALDVGLLDDGHEGPLGPTSRPRHRCGRWQKRDVTGSHPKRHQAVADSEATVRPVALTAAAAVRYRRVTPTTSGRRGGAPARSAGPPDGCPTTPHLQRPSHGRPLSAETVTQAIPSSSHRRRTDSTNPSTHPSPRRTTAPHEGRRDVRTAAEDGTLRTQLRA